MFKCGFTPKEREERLAGQGGGGALVVCFFPATLRADKTYEEIYTAFNSNTPIMFVYSSGEASGSGYFEGVGSGGAIHFAMRKVKSDGTCETVRYKMLYNNTIAAV